MIEHARWNVLVSFNVSQQLLGGQKIGEHIRTYQILVWNLDEYKAWWELVRLFAYLLDDVLVWVKSADSGIFASWCGSCVSTLYEKVPFLDDFALEIGVLSDQATCVAPSGPHSPLSHVLPSFLGVAMAEQDHPRCTGCGQPGFRKENNISHLRWTSIEQSSLGKDPGPQKAAAVGLRRSDQTHGMPSANLKKDLPLSWELRWFWTQKYLKECVSKQRTRWVDYILSFKRSLMRWSNTHGLYWAFGFVA